jgi:site-specific DNA-cytosine methylase
MTKYREWPEEILAECDLLVGGTPCQAFSVAGHRRSLDDERGNLSLVYVHLFHQGYCGVQVGMAVRRLTPRECERLQGFPDDYTLVTYRNKPAADGPRYRALGNSMAVPCMAWLGWRIHNATQADNGPASSGIVE